MSTRYGTTYEYEGYGFYGYEDEYGRIVELSCSFDYPGYWGNCIEGYARYSEDTDTYRIECGVHNQMADYMSNSWETWSSASGFATIDDALAGILEQMKEKGCL